MMGEGDGQRVANFEGRGLGWTGAGYSGDGGRESGIMAPYPVAFLSRIMRQRGSRGWR